VTITKEGIQSRHQKYPEYLICMRHVGSLNTSENAIKGESKNVCVSNYLLLGDKDVKKKLSEDFFYSDCYKPLTRYYTTFSHQKFSRLLYLVKGTNSQN
jgi:hypothetical protein